MHCCRRLLDAAGRRQAWDSHSLQQSQLKRSLGTLDLLGLGVSSCAGLGVYVLSAYVTRNQAGPSSVLSVLVASVSALLAALCHGELAGRMPRAGTGYTFCYVTLGQLSAFVVGWTMAVDHALQSALAAKAWGHYLDFVINDTISSQMETLPTWQTSELFARRPDVLACGFMLIISLSSFLSVKTFSVMTCTLSALSVLVLMAFVCVGYFHVQPHNWTQPPGFFTHGFSGVMSGAALLMTVFAGVDHVACASQETKDPSRHLPSVLPLTSTLLFLLLFLPTSALTLACAWQDLPQRAPIARAFQHIGIHSANYVIGAGAVVGLSATALVGVFHGSRLLYSMALDGLLPAWFAKTSRASVPALGGLVSGVVSSVLALTLELDCLVGMSAIGTLIQFLTSAVVVLYVRYSPQQPVGMCRDYSDVELSLQERCPSPKLVLMANGDLHMHYHHHHHHHHQNQHQHHSHHHHQSSDSSPSCIPPSLSACSALRTSSATESETSALFPLAGDADSCQRVVRSSSSLSAVFRTSSYAKVVPDGKSWRTTRHLVLIFLLSCTGLGATIRLWPSDPSASWWAVTMTCVSVSLLLVTTLGVLRQPQSDVRLYFRTPMVPVVPLGCVALCSLLLAAVPALAWLRFAVCTALGLVVYCVYGARRGRGRQGEEEDQEVILQDLCHSTH